MSVDQNISFRRIHGRIVPIKMTKGQKKKAVEGTALVAAGAGIAVASGKIYRTIVSKSLKFSAQGLKAMHKIDYMKTRPLGAQTLHAASARAKGAFKMAGLMDKSFAVGAKFGRAAAPIRLAGIGLGATLIGVGASKLYSATQNKASKKEKAAIGTSVATAAFITGAYGSAGVRQALKGAYVKAYPFIRAAKMKYRL